MPLHPDVPTDSRDALERWLRKQAKDPEIFTQLQTDLRGTLAQLLGAPVPANLDIQLRIESPGNSYHVRRFEGGVFSADGTPASASQGHGAPNGPQGGGTDPAPGAPDPAPGAPDVLLETATTRYLVLRIPPGWHKGPGGDG